MQIFNHNSSPCTVCGIICVKSPGCLRGTLNTCIAVIIITKFVTIVKDEEKHFD